MSRILIVAATELSRPDFERDSPLALSLKRFAFDNSISSSISCSNRTGLPLVFNAYIEEPYRDDVIVFTHDDVYIDDFWLSVRLAEALKVFDIVGVAGNKRRLPWQPSWLFRADEPTFERDSRENLSGTVCHFGGPFVVCDSYGTVPTECQLLDGVFIAARGSDLLDCGIRFDEQFPYHFYDLDFCRAALKAGLRLGTWPVAVSHRSLGNFDTPEWQRCKKLYFQKWLD